MFNDNSANLDGGGMYNDAGDPSLSNCVFQGNSAASTGGGMYSTNGDPILASCAFDSNKVLSLEGAEHVFGGGLYNVNSDPLLFDCVFRRNSALNFSVGIAAGGAMANVASSPALIRCSFIESRVESDGEGDRGAAIYNVSMSNPLVTNCLFYDNQALGTTGGIYNSNSSPIVANCLFVKNLGLHGAGAMSNVNDSNSLVVNCTFSANYGKLGAGGMSNWSSSPTVSNCILWGNDTSFSGSGTPSVRYSDVEGGYAGEGNIDADPLFALGPSGAWTDEEVAKGGQTTFTDTNASFPPDDLLGKFLDPRASSSFYLFLIVANTATTITVEGNHESPEFGPGVAYQVHDFRLSAGSPCIDAADNTAVPKGIDTDLGGNPRFVDDPDTKDTGLGDPPIVDMGAYEFQPVLCAWDLDNSGDVGVKDLLVLLGAWGPCPPKGDCLADFDDSGDVGVKDLLILLGNWGPCP
jgi:hypothetical protein